jgi:hypothetical protein
MPGDVFVAPHDPEEQKRVVARAFLPEETVAWFAQKGQAIVKVSVDWSLLRPYSFADETGRRSRRRSARLERGRRGRRRLGSASRMAAQSRAFCPWLSWLDTNVPAGVHERRRLRTRMRTRRTRRRARRKRWTWTMWKSRMPRTMVTAMRRKKHTLNPRPGTSAPVEEREHAQT